MAKIKTTVLKYDGTRRDPADFPKIDVIKMFFLLPSFCFHLLSSSTVKNFPLCLFSVRSDPGQRPSFVRTNSEDQSSVKAKDQSPNPDKDKTTGKKSSDSGEEADKDLILS